MVPLKIVEIKRSTTFIENKILLKINYVGFEPQNLVLVYFGFNAYPFFLLPSKTQTIDKTTELNQATD